jgi:hypothetical protein
MNTPMSITITHDEENETVTILVANRFGSKQIEVSEHGPIYELLQAFLESIYEHEAEPTSGIEGITAHRLMSRHSVIEEMGREEGRG